MHFFIIRKCIFLMSNYNTIYVTDNESHEWINRWILHVWDDNQRMDLQSKLRRVVVMMSGGFEEPHQSGVTWNIYQ